MGQSGDLRRGKGHLPPGHEPGPQSRRGARGRPLGMGLLVLLVLGFVAGAVVLLIIAPHAKSPSGARVGAAVFGGVALLMLPLVLWAWRRLYPRQARYLDLRVEPIEVRRGDTVNATVTISDAAKLGERVEMGLVCTEYYDYKQTVSDQNGSHDQRTTSTVDAFATWTPVDGRALQQTLRFTVPSEAPFSFEGERSRGRGTCP
jgi:hypothetical protein